MIAGDFLTKTKTKNVWVQLGIRRGKGFVFLSFLQVFHICISLSISHPKTKNTKEERKGEGQEKEKKKSENGCFLSSLDIRKLFLGAFKLSNF